ncbi:transmembrane protein, putative [Bodo saltans]|uniref:Transmembrane protein, putative n=1 Tax=Bodo saltans TaxID=75058 RepID=A0A0S4J174_BODSA|nr:transmembrane protein, putative [Bodo saltans]|eukprot:CUG80212.1 transmembrane protein, putative [Bodo saltans]
MSSIDDRRILVVRALQLGWRMSKICREMGLAGGGSATLRTFEEGRSRNVDAKYQALLASVNAAASSAGRAAPVANVSAEEQLQCKLDLIGEELDTTRESLKEARRNMEPQIFRDQVVPIIISAGSIVVIVTQFLDGSRDVTAIGLLVTSLVACISGIAVSVFAIREKRRSAKKQRAVDSTEIVGFAVNNDIYHKLPNCGNGKNMHPIIVVDGRRLCKKCGTSPLASVQQMVAKEDRSILVVRAMKLGWPMSKICRTMGLAGGGSATLRTFEEGRSKNVEVKYALLLAAVNQAAGEISTVAKGDVATYSDELREEADELQRQFEEKRNIISTLRDLFLPCVTYAGAIVTVVTQYKSMNADTRKTTLFSVTIAVYAVAIIALACRTAYMSLQMKRLSKTIEDCSADAVLAKVVEATKKKLKELETRFSVHDQVILIFINTWSLFIVLWQYFDAPTSPESRYSAIGLLTTPTIAYATEIIFLVLLIREKQRGASNNAPIVGYEVNSATYHTTPTCGNGHNMPAITCLDNRTLCKTCQRAAAGSNEPIVDNAVNSATYHTTPTCGNGHNMPAITCLDNRTLCKTCQREGAGNNSFAAGDGN